MLQKRKKEAKIENQEITEEMPGNRETKQDSTNHSEPKKTK